MEQNLSYTPSDFVAVFNQSMDYSFPSVVIEGEIASFKVARGQWVYFDIKDEESSLRCFGTVFMLPGPLEDGMLVRIVCHPKLHPKFNFSLNIQSISPLGDGSIAKQAELLYKKLSKEGLFAPERKRPIVYPPGKVALVTSIESAAYADFIKVTAARWPLMEIDCYDALVQGDGAPESLKSVFERINSAADIYDAVVLIRGGGSSQDLAAFNDEKVVRAIAGSRYPVFCAIGHETDESLAELVADKRASTPSNAAELLVPDRESEMAEIKVLARTLNGSVLGAIKHRMTHFTQLALSLRQMMLAQIKLDRRGLSHIKHQLELLSPNGILKRGYAIIRNDRGSVIRRAIQAKKGQKVEIIFNDGKSKAEIL